MQITLISWFEKLENFVKTLRSSETPLERDAQMGDITPSPTPVPSANPPPAAPHPPAISLLTFDELLLERAADADQCPLIAYSKTKHGVEDYELFNGTQLNRLVDGAVKALIKEGVDPVVRAVLSAHSIRILFAFLYSWNSKLHEK